MVLAALGWGEQVGDHDERHREDAAAACALDPPEDDELGHSVAEQRKVPELAGEAAQDRTEEEEAYRSERDELARVRVGELAVDEREGGRHEQVCGRDPGVPLHTLEILDHARQRGRNDGLIERRQE